MIKWNNSIIMSAGESHDSSNYQLSQDLSGQQFPCQVSSLRPPKY